MKYPKRSLYKHAKSQYRVRNRPAYKGGLQKRGVVVLVVLRMANRTRLGGSLDSNPFAMSRRGEVRGYLAVSRQQPSSQLVRLVTDGKYDNRAGTPTDAPNSPKLVKSQGRSLDQPTT